MKPIKTSFFCAAGTSYPQNHISTRSGLWRLNLSPFASAPFIPTGNGLWRCDSARWPRQVDLFLVCHRHAFPQTACHTKARFQFFHINTPSKAAERRKSARRRKRLPQGKAGAWGDKNSQKGRPLDGSFIKPYGKPGATVRMVVRPDDAALLCENHLRQGQPDAEALLA